MFAVRAGVSAVVAAASGSDQEIACMSLVFS